MDFQVIHPGRVIGPRGYHVARRAAIRAENHIPTPEDLKINLFTDGSPVSKCGIGGVGICYGRWLTTHPVRKINSLSYVVPRVHDANECELIALADATLVVLDEIKENLEIMTKNDWKTSVKIWSDSHTALKFLEDPTRFQRFGPGRPTEVRNLILKLVSEAKNLPIKGPVKFLWVPGLSTEMHRTADHMTKNPMVKSGKAPISRTMKMLFPKPTIALHPPLQPMLLANQDSNTPMTKITESEKKERKFDGGMINQGVEEGHRPRENKLKRSAPLDDDIDKDRPRKIRRLNKDMPTMRGYKQNDQKDSLATSADQGAAAAHPSTPTSSRIADARTTPHWSTNFGDCPDYAKPLAIYNFIKSSSCAESFAKVLQKAKFLRRGKRGQRATMESAVNEQLRANEQLAIPAQFFLNMSPEPQAKAMDACFPTVTWSIVQAAVSSLPELQRRDLEGAVAAQLKVNCSQAIYRASLFYDPPQFD